MNRQRWDCLFRLSEIGSISKGLLAKIQLTNWQNFKIIVDCINLGSFWVDFCLSDLFKNKFGLSLFLEVADVY